MLQADNPGMPQYMLTTIVDLYMKDPEWIKSRARELQREDKKGKKRAASDEPQAPRQAVFPCVSIEEEINVRVPIEEVPDQP